MHDLNTFDASTSTIFPASPDVRALRCSSSSRSLLRKSLDPSLQTCLMHLSAGTADLASGAERSLSHRASASGEPEMLLHLTRVESDADGSYFAAPFNLERPLLPSCAAAQV